MNGWYLDGACKEGKRCYWCGRRMHGGKAAKTRRTRDHFWPESRAWQAPKHLYNRIVWACARCNELKGSLLPIEWFHFIIGNIEWPKSAAQKRRLKKQAIRQAAICAPSSVSIPLPSTKL